MAPAFAGVTFLFVHRPTHPVTPANAGTHWPNRYHVIGDNLRLRQAADQLGKRADMVR